MRERGDISEGVFLLIVLVMMVVICAATMYVCTWLYGEPVPWHW